MLLGNYSVLLKSPMKYSSGSTLSVEGALRSNFNKSGNVRNRFYIDQATAALPLYAVPTGYLGGIAWILPQKSGEVGSGNVRGSGSATCNLAGGLAAQSNTSGSGTITSSVAQLVISMLATLAGSGAISSAVLKAYLNATASLSGSGSVSGAQLAALAWATALIPGSGSVTTGPPKGVGELAAIIKGYSELTPEGIRDNVWNAIAANYNAPGTMGNKMNSAASGGVDLNAMAAAVWGYVSRTLTSGGAAYTPEEIATAILAAAQTTPIHADTQMINSSEVIGDGKAGNDWRGVGVPPTVV